jgi:diguanylate cyclase (GGDEF)-like protein
VHVTGRLSDGLADLIVDHMGLGAFVVDRDLNVTLWNRFMQNHDGRKLDDVLGRNLFDCFPELPRSWLTKKFESVFLLKNSAFTSWQHRPYLFRFLHDRPITGGIDFMRQDCTFLPLLVNGEVVAVCVMLFDVTQVAMISYEREAALAALSESSRRDGLTGVFNRHYLEVCLSDAFAQWMRTGDDFCLLMIDLDHFKQINDEFGHLVGDAVLRIAATRIGELLPAGSVFGRYGGEEFAVVLPSTYLADAFEIAQQICTATTHEPVQCGDSLVKVSVSIGVAQTTAGVKQYEMLIKQADGALYLAKSCGRNRAVCSALG